MQDAQRQAAEENEAAAKKAAKEAALERAAAKASTGRSLTVTLLCDGSPILQLTVLPEDSVARTLRPVLDFKPARVLLGDVDIATGSYAEGGVQVRV